MNEKVVPPLALVVDDREDSRRALRSWLRRAGLEVLAVSTGAEGIAAIRDEPIDVAVIDVVLPDMTGFDVCEAIRAHEPTAWLPVVHVSAEAISPAQRSEGLHRGADAYLTEPVEPRELMAVITSLLRRTAASRSALETNRRLRGLSIASADVHAASDDAQVFAAVVAGATTIAGAPASVVLRRPSGAVVLEGDAGGSVSTRAIEDSALDALLEPALHGVTTVMTDDARIVDEPCEGVTFVDESGEPAGAILVPAGLDAISEVLALLGQLALAVTLARANLHALDIEHRIAVVLQESLLPRHPPVAEGVRFAFRYDAATMHSQVGGDFYEAFALDDGSVAVAIGDVVGHSLHAATVMGEVRHALRAYALDGYDPVQVIERLERLIERFHDGMYTSCIYGAIDPRHRRLDCCNAGHLPIVVLSGGTARLVEGSGSLMGVPTSPPTITTVALAPGDRVVMVTDGLVERRGESLDVGLERLRAAIERVGHSGSLEEMIDDVVADVGPAAGLQDDIAIVAFEIER